MVVCGRIVHFEHFKPLKSDNCLVVVKRENKYLPSTVIAQDVQFSAQSQVFMAKLYQERFYQS